MKELNKWEWNDYWSAHSSDFATIVLSSYPVGMEVFKDVFQWFINSKLLYDPYDELFTEVPDIRKIEGNKYLVSTSFFAYPDYIEELNINEVMRVMEKKYPYLEIKVLPDELDYKKYNENAIKFEEFRTSLKTKVSSHTKVNLKTKVSLNDNFIEIDENKWIAYGSKDKSGQIKEYDITRDGNYWTCSCPSYVYRKKTCKHINDLSKQLEINIDRKSKSAALKEAEKNYNNKRGIQKTSLDDFF